MEPVLVPCISCISLFNKSYVIAVLAWPHYTVEDDHKVLSIPPFPAVFWDYSPVPVHLLQGVLGKEC